MNGFCKDDVNPPVPVHENVSPVESGVAKRSSVLPEQIGALLDAVTTGSGLMTT